MHEAFKQSFINLVNDLKKHLETSTIFTMDDIFLNMFKGNTDGWDSIFRTVIDSHGNERTWNDIFEPKTKHLTRAIA